MSYRVIDEPRNATEAILRRAFRGSPVTVIEDYSIGCFPDTIIVVGSWFHEESGQVLDTMTFVDGDLLLSVLFD